MLRKSFKAFLLVLFFAYLRSQTVILNLNRVNITSSLSFFYSFAQDDAGTMSILMTLYMTSSLGWIAMGLAPTQINSDVIRVYMNSAQSLVVQDLYSTGDFAYKLDTDYPGGTEDVSLVQGVRSTSLLNVTFQRLLNTGDNYDAVIVNGTTLKCFFLWQSNSDDITLKYNNGPFLANVYFTSQQICHSQCTSNSMSCVGPNYGDCKCPDGSFLNNTDNTCWDCVNNCMICNNQSSCTTCNNGYYYQASPLACTLCTDSNQYKDDVNKLCTICDSNCAECGSETNCLKCSSGYFVNSITNKCSSCINNCGVCTNANDCTTCKDGFYYVSSSNTCQACPNNCKLCSSGSTCTQCLQDFYFSGTSCVSCTSTGQMQQGSNNGTGICSACVSNCMNCASATSCVSCSDGFMLSADQTTCTQCIVNNCKTCNPTSTCTSCLSGYNLVSNTCQKCSLANCLVCDDSGQNCLTCNTTYSLFAGQCTQCNVDNCAFCNEGNPENCVYCDEGYYLTDNGLCLLGDVDNCLVPWGQTSCFSCSNGFTLSQNISCFECGVRNCQSCLSNNMCEKCIDQYTLQNNYCSNCGTNCQTCVDINTCSVCLPGYYLNSNKQCTKCTVNNCYNCSSDSTSCSQCISGYFLNTQKTCSICNQQYCSQCSNATTCTKCQDGYYLNNNVCAKCTQNNCTLCSSATVCTQCASNYTANSNQSSCFYCPFENCERCDSYMQCAQCKPQFYLSNAFNGCVSCKSNCLNCENSTTCSECSLGYYLQENQCWACSEHCSQCHETACLTCFPGYGLNSNGQCISCNVANCLTCSDNNVCSECISGFTFNSTTKTCGCSPSELWNSTLNKCIPCNQLYSNCDSCNSAQCLTCNSGFYQSSITNQCVACNQDPKCAMCNTTKCLSCVSGYYLLANNTCASCYIDCSNCTGPQSNQCLSCVNGFFLLEGENQCATSNCPNSLCQACVRQTDGSLGCVECIDHYFMNTDLGICDFCDPSCLTCSNKGATNCLTCPSYSLYYKDTKTCVNNCSSQCLTCNGLTNNDCLSCSNGLVLFGGQCISSDSASQILNNFSAVNVGLSNSLATYARTIKSFTQRTDNALKYCSNNNDCFNNGECFQSACICFKGYLGAQCQISTNDLQLAVNKTNDIVDLLVKNLGLVTRILQNTTTNTVNSSILNISLSTLAEITSAIDLWTNSTTINSTIKIINNLLKNNASLLTQSTLTSGFQALSNMVYILNNVNLSSGIMSRASQVLFYQSLLPTIETMMNTTLNLMKTAGLSTYQVYTPYLMVALRNIDLSSSQSPKFTIYSSQYYNLNDVYMTQISFTADSTSLITKINGGNSKVILKQIMWIYANPFPEDRSQQDNLTLATGISSVGIYKTSGEYLSISGISDNIAIRIKKINPSSTIDTVNTNERYACAFWDNSSSLWSMSGIDNDKTTESNNYIGCYTNHLTDFTVVYRNQTTFFAIEFVEVFHFFFIHFFKKLFFS